MASAVIKFTGKLPKIDPNYLRCIYIYLVRGEEVLAQTAANEDGSFSLALPRQVALAAGTYSVQLAVGPAGMGGHLTHLPNVQRIPLKRSTLENAETEQVATENLKLTPEVLELWWTWCRWYCVSGNIVGPDGCPVPGAQVTVNSVGFNLWGFTETPEATVNADQNGHFTACFCWCRCPFCFDCWPCWPIWWECWPWWWEFDILHVIEQFERVQLQPNRAFAGLQTGNILARPQGTDLIRGQGFPRRPQAWSRVQALTRPALLLSRASWQIVRSAQFFLTGGGAATIRISILPLPKARWSSSTRIQRPTRAGASKMAAP